MAKRLQYLSVHRSFWNALKSTDSAKVGDALKAALKCIDAMEDGASAEETAEAINDPVTRIAFQMFKSGADVGK